MNEVVSVMACDLDSLAGSKTQRTSIALTETVIWSQAFRRHDRNITTEFHSKKHMSGASNKGEDNRFCKPANADGLGCNRCKIPNRQQSKITCSIPAHLIYDNIQHKSISHSQDAHLGLMAFGNSSVFWDCTPLRLAPPYAV